VDIDDLNSLPENEAKRSLLHCCGSSQWAAEMTQARPFANASEVIRAANKCWYSLPRDQWLEAFRSHPKIGERTAESAQSAEAANWSSEEQSRAQDADKLTKEQLALLNSRYEQKFGYIFIVCATGKTADEMLALLRERLNNDAEAELKIAAEEQAKITELRIKKLLNQ
jgi:OHCU decarboxylase